MALWIVTSAVLSLSPAFLQTPPEARAGVRPMIRKDHHELSLHISPDFEGPVGDTLFFEAGFGRFLLDGLEARGVLSYALLEDVVGADSDYRTWEFDVVGEYHLDLGGPVVPYGGVGLGWRRTESGDLDESGLTYGPRAGVKFFLADNAAIDIEITYKWATDDVFINDFKAEDTDLSSMIGLRVLF